MQVLIFIRRGENGFDINSMTWIHGIVPLHNNLDIQRFSYLDVSTKYQHVTDITIWVPYR